MKGVKNMNVNFNSIEINYNSIKTNNQIQTNIFDKEVNTTKNHNYYDTSATLELQSACHNINTLEYFKSNNIDIKDYKVKISYLQDFLDSFHISLENDGINCISNIVQKYDELKDNILKYCKDNEKDEKLKRLESSFDTAAAMIKSMIFFKYYDSKEHSTILENEKNNAQNKFVKSFANDVSDSIIAFKNLRNNNYTSSLLNLNVDTLSRLVKSLFKNPTSIENYFFEEL